MYSPAQFDPKVAWPPFRYHPVQSQLWNYTGRFAAIVAGRGSGKTDICQRILVRESAVIRPWPDPLYYWVAPTVAQLKKSAWGPILRKIPKHWILPRFGINKSDLSISLINGATIYLVGADKPHRMEGNQADIVFIDESSDEKPGLFERTVLPMLTRKNGRCFRLGVPKRFGIGKKEFKDYYERGLRGEGGIASFHWKTLETLSEEEKVSLLEQKDSTDPVTWEEQYEAAWKEIGGSVYYNLSDINLRDDFYYDPAREIYVGCDFNVSPMCWTISHLAEGSDGVRRLYVFDEIFLRDTNTQKTLDYLINRYPNHLAGWKFYGDASGRSRKTSASMSDYAIIRNDQRFGAKKVFFPFKNPNVRDRYAAVNLACRSAANKVRLFINMNTCKKLIDDLNTVAYEEGTTFVQDYSGTEIGHMSDALGYNVHFLMPVKLDYTDTPVIYSSVG